MLTHREIVAAVTSFERGHPVETYQSYGLNVWPILRTCIAYRKCQEENTFFSDSPHTKPALFMRGKMLKKSRAFSRNLQSAIRKKEPLIVRTSGIVFFTHSNRSICWGNRHYNTVVDPVVDLLAEHKKTTVVWECGPDVGPRVHRPLHISDHLDHAWAKHKALHQFLPSKSEPPWYVEIRKFAEGFIEMPFAWENARHRIDRIVIMSRLMGGWLRKSGARTLIVDNWYSPEGMAVIAAAKRLGIRTFDLQHGIQTKNHFAYSGFEKSPVGGYEVMPDFFWVWGENDARNLINENRIIKPTSVIIGGNAFLDQWMNSGAPEIRRYTQDVKQLKKNTFARTILVTLSGFHEHEHELCRLIAQSPRDWLWLVRLHRGRLHRVDTVEKILQQSGHPHVLVRQATFMPLYALLQGVEVHVTWCSTCALEALPFGVPSIVQHPSSKTALKTFLDSGVMLYAQDIMDVLLLVPQCAQIDKERCKKEARQVFSPRSENIDHILALFDE